MCISYFFCKFGDFYVVFVEGDDVIFLFILFFLVFCFVGFGFGYCDGKLGMWCRNFGLSVEGVDERLVWLIDFLGDEM